MALRNSRPALNGPLAMASVASVVLTLVTGDEVTGLAFHERHGTFHGAADLLNWAESYAAMYPQRAAVDSIEVDNARIKLAVIAAVK